MTALEEVGRSGGNSREANVVTPTAVDEAKVILNLTITDILGQINLCRGGCPMHCRMAKSIPGLPVGTLLPPFSIVVSTQNTSRSCQMSSGRQKCSRWRNTAWMSSTLLGYPSRMLSAIPFWGPTFWMSGSALVLSQLAGNSKFHIGNLVFLVEKCQTATVALTQFSGWPSQC